MHRVYVSCEILTVPGIFDNEWVRRVNQTLFEACSKEESLASHHVRIVSMSAVKHSHLRILVKSEWKKSTMLSSNAGPKKNHSLVIIKLRPRELWIWLKHPGILN